MSSTGAANFGTLLDSGYRCVHIDKQHYFVHRLVAAAFLNPPPAPDMWQVNHLDGDPSNNHVTNLQYVTPSENQKHSWTCNATRASSAAKLSKSVFWRPLGETCWSLSPSQRDAERTLGVHRGIVSGCCRGRQRHGRGNGVWYEFKCAVSRENELPLRALAVDELWREAMYPGRLHAVANLMVSSHGRVSTMQNRDASVNYGCRHPSGYYFVSRSGRTLLVHRLVAATFLGQPSSPKLQVNHKDLDRSNNHVDNLDYVTPSQNVRHSILNREGPSLRVGRGTPLQARLKGREHPWQNFESMQAAALHTGMLRTRVSNACNNLDDAGLWEFRFMPVEPLPGEEWRAVELEGARCRPRKGK